MEAVPMIPQYTPGFTFVMQMIYSCFGFLLAWWAIRAMNWSTNTDIKNVLALIYSHPIAAAIYRAAVVFSVFYFLGKFVR